MAKLNAVELFGWQTLCVVLGRRGSGKSNTGRVAARWWKAPEGYPQKVLLIDRLTVESGGSYIADHILHTVPEISEIRGKYSLVIVDEADEWLPLQGIPNPTLIDLIRRGRHYGLTVILMTQRPASLSYHARALADKLFLFSLTSESDLKWAEGLDPEVKEYRSVLSRARPGEYLLWDGKDYDCRIKTGVMPLDKGA